MSFSHDDERAIAPRDLLGEEPGEDRVGWLRTQVDERDAHVIGEHASQLEARDSTPAHEDLADAAAGRALNFEGGVELFVRDEAAFGHRRPG